MITYKGQGEKMGPIEVSVYTEIDITPLTHYVRHSPDGFQAGYCGSGPAELARCILLDFFKRINCDQSKVDRIYQQFKTDVISRLEPNFELHHEKIDEWFKNIPILL